MKESSVTKIEILTLDANSEKDNNRSTSPLFWGIWDDYKEKGMVVIAPDSYGNPKEYVKMAGYYFSDHAIAHMADKGYMTVKATSEEEAQIKNLFNDFSKKEINDGEGRRFPPDAVVGFLNYHQNNYEVKIYEGIPRRYYEDSTRQVITEMDGKTIVTVGYPSRRNNKQKE